MIEPSTMWSSIDEDPLLSKIGAVTLSLVRSSVVRLSLIGMVLCPVSSGTCSKSIDSPSPFIQSLISRYLWWYYFHSMPECRTWSHQRRKFGQLGLSSRTPCRKISSTSSKFSFSTNFKSSGPEMKHYRQARKKNKRHRLSRLLVLLTHPRSCGTDFLFLPPFLRSVILWVRRWKASDIVPRRPWVCYAPPNQKTNLNLTNYGVAVPFNEVPDLDSELTMLLSSYHCTLIIYPSSVSRSYYTTRTVRFHSPAVWTLSSWLAKQR